MNYGFFENTLKTMGQIFEILKLPPAKVERLSRPDKILDFQLTVAMDDGSSREFSAWRVQYNNTLGPYKGGIRFHPDSSLDEVKALAALMTWKTSLMSLPYGGGKGAIKVDPRTLSQSELERLSRAYVQAIWQDIGSQKDVPAPDVNTNSQIMDWMIDEYSKLTGQKDLAVFTGKSLATGGAAGRDKATGWGGFVVLREFLKNRPDIVEKTVAIQGFGNVGSHLAKFLFDAGFKIVAVSDSQGALYEPNGIDINKILSVKDKAGIIDRDVCYSLDGQGKCQIFTNDDLLFLPVDILVPAALEDQINKENVSKIKAKVVLEMANGPVTQEADTVLKEKKIDVLPDILANGGGVAGSYFEWQQNLANETWLENDYLKKLEEKMIESFKAVEETKNRLAVDWRLAANARAIERVANALS
ncbi:MAG: Glu/Leu/Phe/Val dehydrogenase [bacterium]|nr:Glu/Leu/Phe/Val dehydrogenase [bacterium]